MHQSLSGKTILIEVPHVNGTLGGLELDQSEGVIAPATHEFKHPLQLALSVENRWSERGVPRIQQQACRRWNAPQFD
jgi:hypothetical protein